MSFLSMRFDSIRRLGVNRDINLLNYVIKFFNLYCKYKIITKIQLYYYKSCITRFILNNDFN